MEKFLVNSLRAGFYLLLFTPLIFQTSLLHPFVTLKLVVFQSLVEILLAFYLTLIIFYPEYRPRPTPLVIAFMTLLLILILTSFLGVDWAVSWWSFQERQIGLFALLHFGVLFLMLVGLRRVINWPRFLLVSFIVSLILSAGAVIQQVYPKLVLLEGETRPGSFLGNPTFLASYLFFHIFLGIWLARRSLSEDRPVQGWLLALGVIFEVGIIFLTETRGALLGLAVSFLVFLFLSALFFKKSWLYGLAALVVLLGVGFFLTRNVPLWQNFYGLSRFAGASFKELGVAARLNAWKGAWEGIKERPILGWGWENFDKPFNKYYRPELLRAGFYETFFDKPHNIFIEYLIAGGLLGLAGFLAVMAVWAWGAWRVRADRWLTVSLLSLLAVYLAQNFFVFDTFGSYLMLAVTLAFIDSRSFSSPLKNGNPGSEIILQSRLAIPLLVFLLMLASLPIYFVNYRTWYASHKEYWGINYFVNRLPEEAIASWQESLATANPYRDFIRKEYASTLQQMFNQGLTISQIDLRAKEALDGLELAIAAKPQHYFLRVVYADAAVTFSTFNQNYLLKADQHIAKSLEISPHRQQSYYVLAKIKLSRGDREGAVATMKEVVDLDPEVGDAHFFYGLLAFNVGDWDTGLAELARAKELGREPKDNHEARVIANYYADAERYDEALRYYDLALQFNDDDVEALLKKGIVYYYKGDRELAQATLAEFLKRVSDFKNYASYDKVLPILEDLRLQ